MMRTNGLSQLKEEAMTVGRVFIRSPLHLMKALNCITLQYSALKSYYPTFTVDVLYLKTYIGMLMSNINVCSYQT